jgi:hypothetical protein
MLMSYLLSFKMPHTECSLVITDKGKGKVVPVLNKAPRHEGVLGNGDIAPLIL